MRYIALGGVLALVIGISIAFGATPEPDDQPPRGALGEFATDFSRHSVPYSEIRSGGPAKDGIPAIDAPRYVSIVEADGWLEPQEPVILVELNGAARAYPVQILMWHEIVNDELGGTPVAVTYCPLCNTGIAFRREFEGQVLDFGTTGRLRFSNLVMYDRQTETWWQQATGEGIVGEHTGRRLEMVPAALVSWADFKAAHPDGDVLSRDTGYSRSYGRNPYTGYDDVNSAPFLFDGPQTPDALPAMARVLTLELNGESVAYPYDVLEEARVVNDTVGGEPIVVLWAAGTASPLDAPGVADGADVGAAAAFSRRLGGEVLTFRLSGGDIVDEQTGSVWDALGRALSGSRKGSRLQALVSVNHFWFSWAAFRPETRVFQPEPAAGPTEEALGGGPESRLPADFAIALYQGEDLLGGPTVRLSEVLAGHGKPVLLVFWAGLCPTCRAELPHIQKVYEERADELLVVAVDIGPFVRLGDRDDALQMIADLNLTFPAGSTADAAVLPRYKVLGTPSTAFLKPDGEMLRQWTGRLSEEQLAAFVEELLAASEGA